MFKINQFYSKNFITKHFQTILSSLCHRLNSIKDLCRRKCVDYEHERKLEVQNEENFRKYGFSGEGLPSKSLETNVIGKATSDVRNPGNFYNDTLDMIKMLLDNNIEQTAFEDVIK